MMSKVLNVNNNDFNKEVLQSDLPVLVDFWAPWCMPCKMMVPILDELSVSMDGKIKVAKVNTEEAENQTLAMEYDIQSVPNMKLFRGGKVVEEFIGLRPLEVIKSELEEIINK
ncbi:thioredoxin [bacterium (Candidatus Gribaldobacteria) CG_4_10_14_0_2_um_filter_36_18]|uniref:Thioredoxin n=1 Tax=bacterium (Candidatus Gribaldobacteria) CG_4_10_14_0_2_um_filter_36_18 TaxID=2014264 RepID=A0A2M7VKF6_9BACT|nr:MAG: thioredoxin [bacterium (Candidatus Gribaldobacteria) CG_4_10_14_0_2_um_filter_36_18]